MCYARFYCESIQEDMKKILISITEKQQAILKKMAKEYGSSMTEIIRQAIHDYILRKSIGTIKNNE